MPVMPPMHRPKGRRSQQEADREHDIRRGSSRDRGYDARWDGASRRYREAHPFCQYCEVGAFGPVRVAASSCTDHLYPQRRWPEVFWLEQWWVAACTDCHAGPKQAAERLGLAELHRLARLLGRAVMGG